MFVQLADSTVWHPEGIVENIYVRIRNCIVLADFVVLNMEGDLGLDLILGGRFWTVWRLGSMSNLEKSSSASGSTIYSLNSSTRSSRGSWSSKLTTEVHSGVHQNLSQKNLRPQDPKEDMQRKCGVRSQARPRPILQDEPSGGKHNRRKVPLVRL